MSDYTFMLDSHLSSDQSKVLALVRDTAAQANLNLFLTGGAMRDMLGGFPIRDLDFSLEGNAAKLAKVIVASFGAKIVHLDETKRSVELLFPSGVTAEIATAREEKHGRPGSKVQVHPATIHEDLRGRDFTINAIALSLSKASHGLLLDPTNGLADIERKELHAVTNYSLYDDPSRILRLIRLRTRLGYRTSERTQAQYSNVREAHLETKIPSQVLNRELHQIALEPAPLEVFQALAQENLLALFSPVLAAKLNTSGFQKLHRAKQLLPFGTEMKIDHFRLVLNLILEKLNAKERAQFIKNCALDKKSVERAAKLDANSRKIERSLTSAKLQRPSALYATLAAVPGEEIIFLLTRSNHRLVVDRIKNYLQKYLPAAQEITDAVVGEHGAKPGTAKFSRVRAELIAARLDSRPKRPAIIEPPPPPPPPAPMMSSRRQSTWGR
jgi:tRNA nucleotidyltransferase (CCA-adding enzyme)